MRDITEIFIHCSYTPASMDIGFQEIDQWHKERGWSGCGYHKIIRRDGTSEPGRPIEKPGAHAKGHNANSIGICLVGGKSDKNRAECNFTRHQWRELDVTISSYLIEYPGAKVRGHNEVSSKTCPTFDVQKWMG